MKKIKVKLISFILIEAIIFSILQVFFIKSEVNALSSSYTQYVTSGISSFPESYQKALAYLKYLHPNWEFKAYYTGISWSDLTSSSAENRCLRNTIYYRSGSAIVDSLALCKCGQSGDSNYYCASATAVNYYLDPRNFLGEAMVFQFLDLSSGSEVSRDAVSQAVQGTYLANYLDDIMIAASQAGINPLHIVATIFQELGKGSSTPQAISGSYPGYEGFYNFYNYGATDGQGATARAMAKAVEMGWNSASTALIEGAKIVLADNYISAGQYTKYFYKFDVVGNEILTEAMGQRTYNSSEFFTHQYMTNLRDPSSQAGSLYDMYVESGIVDENLTFIIPVYDNMPADAVSIPTSITSSDGELYYISTLKNGGLTVRSGPSTSSSSLGLIYKNAVVAVNEYGSSWSRITYCTATTYNSSTKSWNYEKKTGYVSTEYLTKVGTELPDYTGQVDMGSSENIRIEESYMYVTPEVKASDVKALYPDAVIVLTSGVDISSISDNVATGTRVTTGGATYAVIKLGDVNGDGSLKASDYVRIKNHIMNGTAFDDHQNRAADVNRDGSIKASDYVQIKNYIMNGTRISL